MTQHRVLTADQLLCPVCDHVVRAVHDSNYNRVASIHGPRDNPCAGSRGPGVPWRKACQLPAWDELEDADKGQALMFVHKVWWEQSYSYARDNYAPAFRHTLLARLSTRDACRYAKGIVGELGEPLPSVPNMWAQFSTPPFHIYPDTVQEPLIDMARRILGDEECQRLLDCCP